MNKKLFGLSIIALVVVLALAVYALTDFTPKSHINLEGQFDILRGRHANFSGNVTAGKYFGDGSGLTGVASSAAVQPHFSNNTLAMNASGLSGYGALVAAFVNDTNSANWSSLKNYPAACPARSSVTQLEDVVTCTEFTSSSNHTVYGNLTVLGNQTVSDTLNYTKTGVVQVFANGCKTIANSSGMFWIC